MCPLAESHIAALALAEANERALALVDIVGALAEANERALALVDIVGALAEANKRAFALVHWLLTRQQHVELFARLVEVRVERAESTLRILAAVCGKAALLICIELLTVVLCHSQHTLIGERHRG